MIIDKIEFNLFGENTYIVYDQKTRETAVIDPGMMNVRECDMFDRFIERNGLKIKYLINTHIHVDHVAADGYISTKYNVPVSASAKDSFLSERVAEQALLFRLNVKVDNVKIENDLKGGDTLYLGNEPLKVIEVPGHSPGSIALYAPQSAIVITGDALFRLSVGRTDLPGGDFSTLIKAIKTKLLVLPEETLVYPGHGEPTTIGYERDRNPFLA